MEATNKSFKKFLLLWSGEFVSAIGSGLTSFGLGVYVFNLTGKASAMTLVMLLAFLPSLLLGPIAGVLADRYDRRLLMILGDSLSAIGLIYILICMLDAEAKLWQIGIGVTISSVFSSLLEPAYRATVTDLLTKEEYAKASGLVQVAASSKYLISPILAGFLLAVSDIKLLLMLDICTFFLTVTATFVVRKGLVSKKSESVSSFGEDLIEGWQAISQNRGILILIVLSSVITFFLGFIQTLSTPMILAFANTSTLGVAETISAMGMLASSLLIGIFSIDKSYSKTLCVSLVFMGLFMALFGLRENIIFICIAGFLFFSTLPFANTCIDVLVRSHIDNEMQGRAWGLIGIISQLGYVFSYISAGLLADYVFTPMLIEDGALAKSVGKVIGVGAGRGTGFLIIVAGFFICLCAGAIYRSKSVRGLEEKHV